MTGSRTSLCRLIHYSSKKDIYGWKTSKDRITLTISIWILSHNLTFKTTIKSICLVPFSRTFFLKIFCKLLSKYLWKSLFLVKSHALKIFLWTPQDHVILDVKTTFRLQKPHCENFWWKHIKNERCKCFVGNKEQKAMFLVVSRSNLDFGFWGPIS